MELFADIVIAVVMCLALAAVIWSLKGLLLTPVRRRERADVFAVIVARGDAQGLEQAVRGLMWLQDSGRAQMGIIIADSGMDDEARRRAELLAEKNGAVVCAAGDICDVTEEERWREETLQQ